MNSLRRLLAGLLLSISFATCGCATLDAWKSMLSYNHETGEAKTETKGAGPGGKYVENKGLNMSMGDNSATVLLVVIGVLGLAGGWAAYKSMPVSAKKHKEHKEHKEK